MKAFAKRVNEVAAELAVPGKFGGNKVLIGRVWDAMDFPHWGDFKRDLLAAHRAGEVELQRADLRAPRFIDPDELAESAVVDRLGSEWNFVVVQKPKRNPAPQLDQKGLAKYEEFSRLEPRDVICEEDQRMPTRATKVGKAIHVMYRSEKIDPETDKRPRGGAQNYIHEHDAGVHVYEPGDRDTGDSEVLECSDDTTLVLLGECLGLAWKSGSDGEDYEVEWSDPEVELYCTTSGKMLVIVGGKREILYLVWGGALGVEPRGIVG